MTADDGGPVSSTRNQRTIHSGCGHDHIEGTPPQVGGEASLAAPAASSSVGTSTVAPTGLGLSDTGCRPLSTDTGTRYRLDGIGTVVMTGTPCRISQVLSPGSHCRGTIGALPPRVRHNGCDSPPDCWDAGPDFDPSSTCSPRVLPGDGITSRLSNQLPHLRRIRPSLVELWCLSCATSPRCDPAGARRVQRSYRITAARVPTGPRSSRPRPSTQSGLTGPIVPVRGR